MEYGWASGESILGTEEGEVNARDFRRKPENGGRWSVEDFDKFKGVPWEPGPGAEGGYELKSKVKLPTEPSEVTRGVQGTEDFAPSRLRIRKEDLVKFGYTADCSACRAANRGRTTTTGHTEEFGKRTAEELEKIGDERLEREKERLLEYLGEESKKSP